MKFQNLECGFFRHPVNERLYFALPHGNWTFHFPVVNGKICKTSDKSIISPYDEVEVLHRDEWEKFGVTDKNPLSVFFPESIKPLEK
ncbi:MAG: hypothetical protein AAB516_01535 [Patescibacteria group bacterium]